MKSFSSMLTVAAAVALAAIGSSCTINPQHDALKSPSIKQSGLVGTAAKASGMEGRVGWGTFTVFFIPIVPVHVEGDGNGQLMAQVHDALKQAGYSTTTGGGGSGGKQLEVKVDDISYHNYTYLFPIVPTWGGLTVKTSLTRGGQVLWSKEFSGRGATLNFTDGYTISHRKAMTKILNQMVEAFAAPDFHQALAQK